MTTNTEGPSLWLELKEAWAYNDRSLLSPTFHVVALHRVKNAAKRLPSPLALVARSVLHFVWVLMRNVYSTHIPTPVVLGRRFRIVHTGGIVIHDHAVFGDDCILRQGVTVGAGGRREYNDDHATIGDRVELGAGCVVIGRVMIGDDVRIGPNAVVMTDVPSGATVVAPASRVLVPGRINAREPTA